MTTADRSTQVIEGLRAQPGMKDFWTTYERNLAVLNTQILLVCETLPSIAEVIQRMTPEMLAESNRVSEANMRRAFVDGDWQPLLDRQHQDGSTYASMGVPFHEWFELVAAFQNELVPFLVADYQAEPERLARVLIAMNAYVDVAMSNIGEAYLSTKETIIAHQQHAIQELSTPVLKLRERLLLVPLVGVLDTQRARLMTEQLLQAVRAHRAKVVVIDITGVPAVDSKVANHLFQTVAAARLMGAQTVITGLSAEVAQALVGLGIDVSRLTTMGDLQGGLEEAQTILGFRVIAIEAATSGRAS
jgi:rsbT co-antagonist protein RsbR